MIAKLDANKKRIQQRFNPPAAGLFDKDPITYANGRPQKGASISDTENSPRINSSAFPGPIFPGIYEYSPMGPVLDDEPPMSKPIISKYPPAPMNDKVRKYFIISFQRITNKLFFSLLIFQTATHESFNLNLIVGSRFLQAVAKQISQQR